MLEISIVQLFVVVVETTHPLPTMLPVVQVLPQQSSINKAVSAYFSK